MKQHLQLKLSQQLTLTPQLQQAIRLLQLSTIELCQEIQTALDDNPLLEIDEHYNEVTINNSIANEDIDPRDIMEMREIQADASLGDIYSAGTPSGTYSDYRSDELPIYQGETHQTLNDYLIWQLNLTRFNEQDRAIAIAIIEAIDERGYLTVSTQEILEGQGNDEIELAEVEAVLKRIQYFDPVGIGARNLKECLLIQLNQLTPTNPQTELAKTIIKNHIELLGNRDFKTLKKILTTNEEDLKIALSIIQNLHPLPGEAINTESPKYIIPDVVVKKIANKWQVLINNETIPNLKINQTYAAMEKNAKQSDGQYIRQALQEANWLIKSIANRNSTLAKVSQFIVEHQQNFFEHGVEYMKPMILADVANAIDMHESTISRITTQKYLQCSKGVFELKYFFSSRINTESGGEVSSTVIRALIKKMIANEECKKPLSDSKIVSLLEEQGIIVARRTVSKYRELMQIPPSNLRKRLH
ncbi:RNA polymerase factor sigma-54 [Orbaceae bacterium ac157xtp]